MTENQTQVYLCAFIDISNMS